MPADKVAYVKTVYYVTKYTVYRKVTWRHFNFDGVEKTPLTVTASFILTGAPSPHEIGGWKQGATKEIPDGIKERTSSEAVAEMVNLGFNPKEIDIFTKNLMSEGIL